MKNIPEWKQYEWLISKIFYDSYSEIETTVLSNSTIRGQHSERSRQIDILIQSKSIKTIVECKKYQTALDIKDVESFLGMFNDVNADYGIMVASAGFSKSAIKRVSEYKNKIFLEHIEWEKAYNSINFDSSRNLSDICLCCINDFKDGLSIPGLLCWDSGYAFEHDGVVSIFCISKCLKCGNQKIYCDACGVEKDFNEDSCCEYSRVFLQLMH